MRLTPLILALKTTASLHEYEMFQNILSLEISFIIAATNGPSSPPPLLPPRRCRTPDGKAVLEGVIQSWDEIDLSHSWTVKVPDMATKVPKREGPNLQPKKRRASCKGCIETGLARIEADTAEV